MLADLRAASRSLARTPAFTAVVVGTLALGIGANTAIFSVVNAVLLRPAPVRDLERLVMVWETDRNSGTTREPASVPDYLDFQSRGRSFEALSALMAGEVNLAVPSGDPVRLSALRISHGLFPMLGIQPVAGRAFTAEEDRAGGPDVALISELLWTRLFGRDPDVVGRTLTLDDRAWTILGVMPDGSDFGVLQLLSRAAYSRSFADRGVKANVDVWVPLQPDPRQLPRDTHPIFVIGRLARGIAATAAQREMDTVSADLERAYPVNAGRGVNVEPLADVVFGPVRPALYLLLGAVVLVLLVACVNVANLLLARSTVRARELSVRAALGASPARLARHVLVETTLLTTTAAVAGVALAYAVVRALAAIAPPDVPRLSLATIDRNVLGLTLVATIAVAAVFGLLPAIRARGLDLQAALTDSSMRGSAGPSHTRLRGGLVIAELALAVVLVSGAGLLIRSFWMLQHVDAGFHAQRVLKAEYQLPPSRYPADFRAWPMFKEQHAFSATLLSRVGAIPGVESAAIAGNHPLDPGFTNSFSIVGREAEARTWPEISIRRVTAGYFRTVDLPLLRGRYLAESDTTLAAPVAVINAAAARRFFASGEPLGSQIRFWGAARTIVGIVADEKFHGLAAAAPIGVYTPLSQTPSANGAGVLLVRTPRDPMGLAAPVTRTIHQIDPLLAVFGVERMTETVARSVGQQRFTMLLLGLFAAFAVFLAAVGVHGVLSYGVVRRRREIGIRVALGATRADLVRVIVGEGLMFGAIGTAIGLLGALALTRFLRSLLFGVTSTDPVTLVCGAALLLIIALAAAAAPARRAASVDPVLALRSE